MRIYLQDGQYWPITKELLTANPDLKTIVHGAVRNVLRETEDLLETLCS
jgi:hypothetical protein